MSSWGVYSEVRASGVDWLGDIPATWEVWKLQHTIRIKSGDNIVATDIQDDGAYPVYGANGLRGYCEKYTHDGHYVLIGRQGALCGNINYAKGKFWASEHALVVSPSIKCVPGWLGELLRAMELNQYSVSAAQPGLSTDNLARLQFPVPPLEDQQEIAAFLDEKTAKIDELIDDKQHLLALLAEKRRALITHSVTKGLDCAAPTKASGIDWLGDIPATWDAMKSRRFCFYDKGKATRPEFFIDDGMPLLAMEYLRTDNIPDLVKPSQNDIIAYAGDILLLWDGSNAGEFLKSKQGVLSATMAKIFLSAKIHKNYIYYAFKASEEKLKMSNIGMGIPHVDGSSFKELPYPIPPLEEQQEIAAFLDEKTAKIDDMVSQIEESITLLKEYRISLITHAVTGKIKVV